MEINASCTYNLEALLALRRSHMTKKRYIFLCILFAFLIVETIFLTWLDSFPFLLVAVFVLVAVLFCYLYIWAPKLEYQKRSDDRKDCVVHYTFRESTVHISVRTANVTEDTELAYAGFYRAEEGQRYFYLYPSRRAAYIVDKTTMDLGHASIISGWLQSSLGKSYKRTGAK